MAKSPTHPELSRIEEVTSFRTFDGEVHKSILDAKKHTARIQLNKWADDVGLCRGGEWGAEMVIEAMKEHAPLLGDILYDYAGLRK